MTGYLRQTYVGTIGALGWLFSPGATTWLRASQTHNLWRANTQEIKTQIGMLQKLFCATVNATLKLFRLLRHIHHYLQALHRAGSSSTSF